MNGRSLKLIRDVIINSGKMTSVEISHDSIYLQFSDVELGTPKLDSEFNLTARFGEDSFLTAFYNNIWDIDFLSKYNFTTSAENLESCEAISERTLFSLKVNSNKSFAASFSL